MLIPHTCAHLYSFTAPRISPQANGTAFDSPHELLRRVGLLALTQQSFASCLKEELGSDSSSQLFGSEFAAGVNRVNYNQGSHINALAGTWLTSTVSKTGVRAGLGEYLWIGLGLMLRLGLRLGLAMGLMLGS